MPKPRSHILPFAIPAMVIIVLFLKEQGFKTSIVPSLSIPKMSSFPVAQNTSSLDELKQSVHQRVNEYRASQNLPPLKLDPRISQEAKQHSEAMASGEVPFSHAGSKQRFDTIGETIPYQKIAENVGYNMGYSDPAQKVVQGWINSEGHRRNIEGNFDLTGIGIAKNAKGEYYFTQIFVRTR
ncbi:MAG: CAP domain-containing protein [Lyngbya sp.]|nr:CAP domain-containing protein [Lyngbya sp.]